MINPKYSLLAETLNHQYNSAPEYPHIVLDDFLDPTVIADAEYEAKWLTDNFNQEEWRFGSPDYHEDQWLKRGIKELDKMTYAHNLLCRYMNSYTFIEFLRKMSGIEDLVPDWELEGGGFHVTYPDGSLNIHHDFNYKEIEGRTMYRKINLLIYLNEEWLAEWDGSLELWKSDLSECFEIIDPKHNRAVFFNIEDAPHGHPQPLKCPQNDNRRSLAFYYYSAIPPKNRLYDRAHWKHGNRLV